MAYLDCFGKKKKVTSTKYSCSPRFLPTCRTLFIMSLHVLSTVENRLPSSGIWDIMSGELKMGSRYSHVAWTLSHSSRISWSSSSLPSQSLWGRHGACQQSRETLPTAQLTARPLTARNVVLPVSIHLPTTKDKSLPSTLMLTQMRLSTNGLVSIHVISINPFCNPIPCQRVWVENEILEIAMVFSIKGTLNFFLGKVITSKIHLTFCFFIFF